MQCRYVRNINMRDPYRSNLEVKTIIFQIFSVCLSVYVCLYAHYVSSLYVA